MQGRAYCILSPYSLLTSTVMETLTQTVNAAICAGLHCWTLSLQNVCINDYSATTEGKQAHLDIVRQERAATASLCMFLGLWYWLFWMLSFHIDLTANSLPEVEDRKDHGKCLVVPMALPADVMDPPIPSMCYSTLVLYSNPRWPVRHRRWIVWALPCVVEPTRPH